MLNKQMIIVESPTKAKTLNKFLKGKYIIEASMGHIRDLPAKEFGIKIENDSFKPKYILSSRGRTIGKKIKSLAQKADSIFLASDPDREGESIAWHLYEILKGLNKKIKRIEFHEITKSAVEKAINNSTGINMNRVNAQQARRILDRIVGYELSPILWRVISKGLSAGRVQSVALRLICEREEKIDNFKPEEYWNIYLHLLTENKEQIKFELTKLNKKKFKVDNEKDVDLIIEELKKIPLKITDIQKKSQKRNPAPPLITSKLQQLASNKYNYSASRTMMIAQQLYEGVKLQDGNFSGLITYMRTDSVRISNEAADMAQNYILRNYGEKYYPAKRNFFKQKSKNVQDAHEAIRPTDVYNSPEKIKSSLTSEQFKIYDLIWRVFVASQMTPAQFDVTNLIIDDGKYTLTSKGSILKFDGFQKVLNTNTSEKNVILPDINKNSILTFEKFEKTQHFTKPPARYTEATLVKALEEKGIGRPSTYASIIFTILKRKYVMKEKRNLSPTDLGKDVNAFLVSRFSDVINVKFTADLEEKLDLVEGGKQNWQQLLKEFYITFKNNTNIVMKNIKQIKSETQKETDIICEKCGAKMILKRNQNGHFIACPTFPKCKNIKPVQLKGEEIIVLKEKVLDEKCPDCGKNLLIKNGKFGRFTACSDYPKCKYVKKKTTGIKCPKENCDGELVERTVRRGRYKGKTFYGCSNFPKCKHVQNELKKEEEKINSEENK